MGNNDAKRKEVEIKFIHDTNTSYGLKKKDKIADHEILFDVPNINEWGPIEKLTVICKKPDGSTELKSFFDRSISQKSGDFESMFRDTIWKVRAICSREELKPYIRDHWG